MRDDLEPFLVAVSPDAPSGVDLEYDPDFSRMEKAAQGTPDQEFGATKIEGSPADWDEVRDAALSILQRSRDLRAATLLAEAELCRVGIIGFRDALQLISVYIDQFWDTVFPQLDADDDDDPTSRINALAGLSKVGGLIRQLRMTPILISRSVGRFSWTDCAIAKGDVPTPAGMESPPLKNKLMQRCWPAIQKNLEKWSRQLKIALRMRRPLKTGSLIGLDQRLARIWSCFPKSSKRFLGFRKFGLQPEKRGKSTPVIPATQTQQRA